jgi:hypothetical protein
MADGVDLSVDLIKATVQLEQPLGDGSRSVGTGFLISCPDRRRQAAHHPDHRRPRVRPKMPVGRGQDRLSRSAQDGVWRYDPQTLKIRTGDHPLDQASDARRRGHGRRGSA